MSGKNQHLHLNYCTCGELSYDISKRLSGKFPYRLFANNNARSFRCQDGIGDERMEQISNVKEFKHWPFFFETQILECSMKSFEWGNPKIFKETHPLHKLLVKPPSALQTAKHEALGHLMFDYHFHLPCLTTAGYETINTGIHLSCQGA